MTIGSRAIAYLTLCAIAIVLSLWNPLARTAADYNREVAVGGTALYGTLRTINAVMSVAKEGEVHVSVGVASGSRSPGQVLQPVTETINRTADALFMLIVIAGALSVTIAPLAAVAAAILAVSAGLLGIAALVGRTLPGQINAGLFSLFRLGLLGALIVPGAYGAAFLIGDRATASAWSEASAIIRQIDVKYGEGALPSAETIVPLEAVEEAPSTGDASAQSGGLLQSGLRVFGSAVDTSREAISGTVAAASDLASSVGSIVADNISVVLNAMSLGSELFPASVEVVVAYLVKLIILPFLIIAAALYVLRSIARVG